MPFVGILAFANGCRQVDREEAFSSCRISEGTKTPHPSFPSASRTFYLQTHVRASMLGSTLRTSSRLGANLSKSLLTKQSLYSFSKRTLSTTGFSSKCLVNSRRPMAIVSGYQGIRGYAAPATKGDKGVVCILSQASAHALIWGHGSS